MLTFYYLFVALCQIVFLFLMQGLFRKSTRWYALFPLIILCGIIYDNLVIGLGSFVGEGDTLKLLNLPRFVIHAFFTPTLIVFAFGVARRVGIGWAQSKLAHILFCLLATAMIALGIYHEIVLLEMVPEAEHGTIRYVNASAEGAPVPPIVTILVSMIVGVFVWVKAKFPWYFVGSLLMFILAPLAATMVWAGNLGEIFMSFGNVSGERIAQNKSNN